MQTRVRWTADEWDELALIVFELRREDPTSHLMRLCDLAMDHFPVERRRRLQVQCAGPLVDRLKGMNEALNRRLKRTQELEKELAEVKEQLRVAHERTVTRQEVLDNLRDDEILDLFGPKVIAKMMELLTRRALRPSGASGNGHVAPQPPPTSRQKKVAIMGPKGDQIEKLQEKLPEFKIIEVRDPSSPPKADLHIIWVNFVSHASCDRLPGARQFKGGLNKMAEFIKDHL